MSIPWAKLTSTFVLIKSVQLLVLYNTPLHFDTSSALVIAKNQVSRNEFLQDLPLLQPYLTLLLEKFIAWDSVYFNNFFIHGIKFEHQFVFCPSWWRIIHYFPYGHGNYYRKLLLSIVISNLSHYSSSIILYHITDRYFPSNFTKNKLKFNYYTSILYILSPGGIFFTGSYSENISNLLSFLVIYLHDFSLNYSYKTSIKYTSLYILAGLLAGINITIRANTILLGGLFLFDVYGFLIKKNWLNSLISIFSGSLIIIGLIILNLHSYFLFCPGRDWCNNTIPLLFNYAQNAYWNVGFLNYWTLNNISNFLFALPTILINLIAINYFIIELPRIKKLSSLIFINSLLIIGGIFFWNIQILTRISAFIPLSYWFTSILLINDSTKFWGKIIVIYQIFWIFFQSSLFSAFLPPA